MNDEEIDIRNPNGMYEEGSEEHEEYLRNTPNPKDPRRNLKGHYLKGISGNYKGKHKNAKSKVSTQRLAHFFRHNGVDALEMAMDIARKSFKKGDNNTALKATMFVGGEMIKFAMNQEKNEMAIQIQKQKDKAKDVENSDEDLDEEDDTPEFGQVVFKSFRKASGDE